MQFHQNSETARLAGFEDSASICAEWCGFRSRMTPTRAFVSHEPETPIKNVFASQFVTQAVAYFIVAQSGVDSHLPGAYSQVKAFVGIDGSCVTYRENAARRHQRPRFTGSPTRPAGLRYLLAVAVPNEEWRAETSTRRIGPHGARGSTEFFARVDCWQFACQQSTSFVSEAS
jgi:hypothetical protein